MSFNSKEVIESKNRTRLARRLQVYCGIEDVVDYDELIRKGKMKEEVLHHCSMKQLPISREGRLGFHYEDVQVKKFYLFLCKSQKACMPLEKAFGNARETYASTPQVKPVVLFNIDKDIFVYSGVCRTDSQEAYIKTKIYRGDRFIQSLVPFLRSMDLLRSQEED